MERLPGGGKPWFVRVRSATSYKLNPCSVEGWLVVLVYLAVTLASILILFPRPDTVRWVIWGTVEIVSTILLIVIALRTSVPAK